MYTKMGMNKKTDNIFMDSIPYTPLDVERAKRINHIYSVINLYTIHRDKFFTSFLIKKHFDNIVHEDEMVEHYFDDHFDFYFFLLSDMIEGNKRMVKDLKSDNRYHRCHESAIGMCLNDQEGNMKVLTGFMPASDRKYHHSVIELNKDDNTLILDFTQNLVMLKDDYIKLYDFEIVNEVTSEEIKKDVDIMIDLNMRTPFYLFFRDELINDLKKNNKVLKLEY